MCERAAVIITAVGPYQQLIFHDENDRPPDC
jgi:hypothetical protein